MDISMNERNNVRFERELVVCVIAARNLKGEDPFCIVSSGNGLHERTKTLYSNTKPYWGHDMSFAVTGGFKGMQCVVWNENKKKRPTFLGRVEFAKQELIGDGRETWYKLQALKTKANEYVSGDIHLRLLVKGTSVTCHVIEARNLAFKDSNGFSDPFAKLRLGDVSKKSKVKSKTLNPVFDEEFELERPSAGAPLVVEVWDRDKLLSNEFMGAVTLNLSAFAHETWVDGWYDLQDLAGNSAAATADAAEGEDEKDGELGEIQLKLSYSEDLILPLHHYEELRKAYLDPEYAGPKPPTPKATCTPGTPNPLFEPAACDAGPSDASGGEPQRPAGDVLPPTERSDPQPQPASASGGDAPPSSSRVDQEQDASQPSGPDPQPAAAAPQDADSQPQPAVDGSDPRPKPAAEGTDPQPKPAAEGPQSAAEGPPSAIEGPQSTAKGTDPQPKPAAEGSDPQPQPAAEESDPEAKPQPAASAQDGSPANSLPPPDEHGSTAPAADASATETSSTAPLSNTGNTTAPPTGGGVAMETAPLTGGGVAMEAAVPAVGASPAMSAVAGETLLAPCGEAIARAMARVPALCTDVVARCTVATFIHWGCAPAYLCALVRGEVEGTDDANTIFRGNSLATKAADAYLRAVAPAYLRGVLQPFVDEVVGSEESFETDPSRAASEEAAEKNMARMRDVLGRLLQSIFASANDCPWTMRRMSAAVQRAVMDRFPEDPDVRFTAVSGFVFLRFFCRAMMTPHLFGLCADAPDPKTLRSLTLMAKTIQNLANFVRFGEKETSMVHMNPFLDEHEGGMRTFLNAVASTDGLGKMPESEEAVARGAHDDVEKALAFFHGHLDRHIDDVIASLSAVDAETYGWRMREAIAVVNAAQDRALRREEQHVRDVFRRAIAPGIHRRMLSMSSESGEGAALTLSDEAVQAYKDQAVASPEKFRFVDRLRTKLTRGGPFVSLTKKGPRAVLLYCVLSERKLFCEDQRKGSKPTAIPFGAITQVTRGYPPSGSVGGKKDKDRRPSVCVFSIDAGKETLCLECETEGERDDWSRAFEFLMEWQTASPPASSTRSA